jgi:hypothetical protein
LYEATVVGRKRRSVTIFDHKQLTIEVSRHDVNSVRADYPYTSVDERLQVISF